MSDYPMHGYLYTPKGFHGPPAIIATRDELHTFLRIWGAIALETRLECLITSGDDEACFCHIKDGAVLYASGVEPSLMAQAIRGGIIPQPPETNA